MKENLIVGNFKENIVGINEYLKSLKPNKNNTVVCPNFLELFVASKSNNIKFGAQDVSVFNGGSFTGETSAKMLKKFGVEYCIVGHSERRKFINETNAQIKIKIENLLEEQIVPILCVGEYTFLNYDNSINEINYQIKDISSEMRKKIIVAYEPVWAIGQTKPASNEWIEKICNHLKNCGFKNVLYGGSVDETNSKTILNLPSVNGLLVGRASLNAEQFNKIIDLGEEIKWKTRQH